MLRITMRALELQLLKITLHLACHLEEVHWNHELMRILNV